MRKPLSLYIHIPFCKHKCIYCDFLSFDNKTNTTQIQYINALTSEIRLYKPYADRFIVKTIYIGGGTPTILDEAMIGKILDTVRHIFKVDRFPEITIEANPGTIKYTDLISFREYGINRLSIGLQSADSELLRRLGRIHNYEEFLRGYENARRAGFENISVDVMSSLPGQDLHTLVDTITKVGEMSPEHISVYSLQVEEGTPLYDRDDLINMIPDENLDREMYIMTKKVLKSFGYNRYEFSNYSKPGYESRHNTVYWTGGQYIGFGIGAASFFKGQRFKNIENIESYIEICEDIRDELTRDTDRNRLYDSTSAVLRTNVETMFIDKRMEEFMFLGLRMTAGVSREEFKLRFNREMFDVYGEVINKYTDQGFMSVDEKRVKLTDRGIDVSNYILADFILDK
ncbi:oxygen-independent coproporphyrinogen-3 oxidase [Lachnospiraceae bacterium]|nr:oxygen-independent coproporphyrinogen-3 oxidase [Lachnospiraceae bacterium]